MPTPVAPGWRLGKEQFSGEGQSAVTTPGISWVVGTMLNQAWP